MLYQEIRPTKLSEIIGNRSTVNSLESLVKRKSKDRPHTILLSGPSGCGKTTLARILASEFGTTEENIIEVDAADVRGIDGIRSIKEDIQFSPMGGGSVTYIMDEAHRLTKDAQSALLKCTEDTPLFVNFVLATTNKELLLPTLRNRCSEYEVSRLSHRDVLKVLEIACEKKAIKIDFEILKIISENCEGCPRAGLVILEKIVDVDNPDEIAEIIVSEIETKENTPFFDFCKLLLIKPKKRQESWKKILSSFEKLEEPDSERIRLGIIGFMRKQLFLLDEKDVEYAKDITEIMEVLASQNTYYGGRKTLLILIMKICF